MGREAGKEQVHKDCNSNHHGNSASVTQSPLPLFSTNNSSPKEGDKEKPNEGEKDQRTTTPSSDKAGTFCSNYDNDQLFETALQLYNKQMECLSVEGRLKTIQRWEYKSQVQLFQTTLQLYNKQMDRMSTEGRLKTIQR